ncbi:MAG: TraM recognition domain-containing protein [Candidatus Saccharimonas sp.]|nr:TraM recognition domain-containing protein [Planctomycetaceae bacterium]
MVRNFWMREFAGWSKQYRTEAVAAIQNKIRPFLTNRTMRAIVSQPGRSLNLREIMDQGKVLIVNLSKGRVGEDNATLLGAFLVTTIQQASMTRADVPEDQRRDFFLYIDEFQNFTTSSFASILSEARKYRLSLTIAHQYLKQLDDATADAVFGNVGSIIAFQVGTADAEVLAEQLSKHPGQLQSQDLTNLPKYTAYARLLIDGMPSNPFSMQTLSPPSITDDRLAIVTEHSRRQHAQPFEKVQAEIASQWRS